MGTALYSEYVKFCVSIIRNDQYERKFASFWQVQDMQDNKVELIIKYYKQAKNGVSTALYNFNKG